MTPPSWNEAIPLWYDSYCVFLIWRSLPVRRSKGAPQAQCARSATIWASGRTRDPYFEILGAPRGIMVTPSGGFDF